MMVGEARKRGERKAKKKARPSRPGLSGRKVLQSLPDGTDRLREDRDKFNLPARFGCVTQVTNIRTGLKNNRSLWGGAMSPTQSRLSASTWLVASLTVTAIELRLHRAGAFPPPIDVWTAATCASSLVWLLRPSREARQAPRDRPGSLLSQRRTTRLLPLGAYDKDLIRCR